MPLICPSTTLPEGFALKLLTRLEAFTKPWISPPRAESSDSLVTAAVPSNVTESTFTKSDFPPALSVRRISSQAERFAVWTCTGAPITLRSMVVSPLISTLYRVVTGAGTPGPPDGEGPARESTASALSNMVSSSSVRAWPKSRPWVFELRAPPSLKLSRCQTVRASENPRRRLGRRGHGTNRKPSSVSALARRDGHLSGMAVAGHLEQPTRGSPLPVWSVWVTPRRLFGLAPTGGCSAARCCQERGGLLPHLFTLTLWSLALPQGGLLSVALSVASRRPGVTWQSTRWSSDFPRRGLRLPATNPFIPWRKNRG